MRFKGEILKALLFNKKMKQWQLARILNLPESYLSRLITGSLRPTGIIISRMAKALDVKPEEIARDESL